MSGGADSVALFTILKRIGCEIVVVNCNFHLRGEESIRDSRFVAELCSRFNIPLIYKEYDVEAYIDKYGGSIEMACRELRYEEFYKILKEEKGDRIAVAHNADDQVETVLMNLFRGSGVKGLRGMREDTGKIIRPLLSFSRKDIEEYLKNLGETYVIDSTNKKSCYRRNFIRNELFPMIETRWPQVRKSILKTANNFQKEENALDYLEGRLHSDDDILGKHEIEDCFDREWLIRRFVVSHGGSEETSEEIARSVSANKWPSGKRWMSPDGEFVISSHGVEWLAEESEVMKEWHIDSFLNTPELFNRICGERNKNVFWTSISPEELEFRKPRKGDKINPLGMKGSKLVSDVLSDAKLPAAQKRNVEVIVRKIDGEILWVEGLKRSLHGLCSPENKIVWRIVGNNESNY